MDKKNLKARYSQLIGEAKKLATEWSGKETEMPAEVSTKIDGLLGQADEIKAKLDLATRIEEGEGLLEPEGTKAAHLGWREAGPDEGNAPVDAKNWRELTVQTPFGERKVRYNVPVAVETKGYDSAFEAYLRKGYGEMGPQDRKTLSLGVDSAGGFLSPAEWHQEMIAKSATMATVRAAARVVQTSKDMAQWPRRKYTTDDKYTSGVRMSWTGETPATNTIHRVTDPVFGLITINAHTAMASMPVTNTLLEDSSFDVMGMGTDLMGEAFTLGENDAFWNGTGTNQPRGILTSPDDSAQENIKSTLTGSVGAMAADGLIDLFYAVPAQYRGARSRFYMNSNTMKAIEKLKDAQNRYIVQSMINGINTLQADTIKNRPIIIDEFLPDVATGNFPVVFGDLSGYIILDRVGLSIQRLSELYAETDITLLLARKRVGGQLVEPWRVRAQKVS